MSDVSRHSLAPHAETLRLSGEFDLASVASVERAFEEVLAAAASTVIVDLSAVTFMDSTMLNFLQQARLRSQGLRVDLLIVRPPEQLWRTFEITMLDRLFSSFDSEDAALAHALQHEERVGR